MSVNTPRIRWIRLFAALLALSLIAGIIPAYASDSDQMHVEIHVTDEDGQPVPGIRINLAGTSSIGEPVSMTDETGSGGVAIFDGLRVPGEDPYLAEPEELPDYYRAPSPIKVSYDGQSDVSIDLLLQEKRGGLIIKLPNAENTVGSTSFHLFGTSMSGQQIDATADATEAGIAVFEGVPITGSEAYTLELVHSDAELQWQKEIKITHDDITYVTYLPQSGATAAAHVSASAVTPPTQTTQPVQADGCIQVLDALSNAPISGVQMSVYDQESNSVRTGSTDENGCFSVSDLQAGKYTYVETGVPDEYLLNRKTGVITVRQDGTIEGSLILYNQPKSQTDDASGTEAEDAVFTVPKTGNIHWDVVLKWILAIAAINLVLLSACLTRLKGGGEGDAL